MNDLATAPSPPDTSPSPVAEAAPQRISAEHLRAGARPGWSLAERVSFRFFFIYLVLYFFPIATGLGGPDALGGLFDTPWAAIVAWVGRHLLHIEIAVGASTGSGDTTYDYVRVLCMAILALAGCVVWSVADRRRRDYRALLGWTRIWLRYALATSMLAYGSVKVIKLQFSDPSIGRLLEPIGESSPMGLLWTFMGFSTGYTFFAGASEILGGVLLFFRRTTTLGALVVAGVMTNVVMLNFCYDVPVKLGSSHLLLLAVFLAAPDARRLADLFVLNRPTAPVDLGPHLARRWMRWSAIGLKVLVIGAIVGDDAIGVVKARATRTSWADVAPPGGWYMISSFTSDGAEAQASVTDLHRWTMVSQRNGYLRLWAADRSSRLFKLDGEPANGAFGLLPTDADEEPIKNAAPVGRLELAVGADGAAVMSGTLEGHAVRAVGQRKTAAGFPLMERGFHWVSETPHNK